MYEYGKFSPPVSPPISPTVTATVTQTLAAGNATNSCRQARHTATAKRHKYLRRIIKFQQMDFEYAFWQMLYLLIAPQKVFRNFVYRKETKDQWARDDPAFLVLLSFWLCISSVGFAFVLKLHLLAFFKFLLWVIFVDCIGVGLLIASAFWLLTNKYMIVMPTRGQDVEWGYAFDIHLNAFFPLLMVLHFFQLPLLNAVIMHDLFISVLIGNTFWLFGIGYYIYITFLGYSSLPFLKNTRSMLYPMTVLALFYIISVCVGWNLSRGLCFFYKSRVW